jgi:hypothetical protein
VSRPSIVDNQFFAAPRHVAASVGGRRRTPERWAEPAVTSLSDRSRRLHFLALAGCLLLFGAGVALASAAEEPPPTTTDSTPTTTAPATATVMTPTATSNFGWELAGRPHPRPRPPTPSPQVSPLPTTTTAMRPATTHRPSRPHVRHVKVRPPVARSPRFVKPRRTGAVLAADATEGRSPLASALTVAALSLAIAFFTVGAAPAAPLRWRRGGVFAAYHRSQVTVAGAVSLLLAAVLFVLTQGR